MDILNIFSHRFQMKIRSVLITAAIFLNAPAVLAEAQDIDISKIESKPTVAGTESPDFRFEPFSVDKDLQGCVAPSVSKDLATVFNSYIGCNIQRFMEVSTLFPEQQQAFPDGSIYYKFVARQSFVYTLTCQIDLVTDLTGVIIRWQARPFTGNLLSGISGEHKRFCRNVAQGKEKSLTPGVQDR